MPPAKKSKDNSFSKTGIAELDILLGGGIPHGHVVLLAGNAGTGKTMLSMQWLFHGAVKERERGIYMTLTEGIDTAINDVKKMGFCDQESIDNANINFVDIRATFNLLKITEISESDVNTMADTVFNIVKETEAKRLVIDSVTAIAQTLQEQKFIRYFIFRLGSMLKKLDCTIILTSEVPDERVSVYGVEEFISDGIIKLEYKMARSEFARTLQALKMRGAKIDQNLHHYIIDKNGIKLFPRLRVTMEYGSTRDRLSIGVPTLDNMLNGGLFRGSSTVITGSTGGGKSLLCTHFVLEGLKKGEPCLYIGFEENREQILRNAASFGWDLEEFEKSKLLSFHCTYPGSKMLEEHFIDIKHFVERHKIKRCAFDSLTALKHSFSQEDFITFSKSLNTYLKSKSVTTLFTSVNTSLVGNSAITEQNTSSIMDNIILLRYAEIQGELRNIINILKIRGSSHSKGLRMYKITNQGMNIGLPLKGYEGILTGSTRKVSDSMEERLEDEFKRFIGPMTSSVFSEMREKGLTEKAMDEYIDGLAKKNILSPENAAMFKTNIAGIMGSSHQRETKIDESTIAKFVKNETPEDKKENFIVRWLKNV